MQVICSAFRNGKCTNGFVVISEIHCNNVGKIKSSSLPFCLREDSESKLVMPIKKVNKVNIESEV